MSRRCKPGQRARVIGNTVNAGAVVVVVRYYRGEVVSDALWPEALFPWVVTSLGAPLDWSRIGDGSVRGRAYTIVIDDSNLKPLDDDDEGLTRHAERSLTTRPFKTTPRSAGADTSRRLCS